MLYALGRPLSVDWSAIYSPHTPGAYVHSTVVPEHCLAHPWDKNGAALGTERIWRKTRQESFENHSDHAVAVSVFERNQLTWQRTTAVDRSEPDQPVILIRDTFEGTNAALPKVASFNLMATGAVTGPGKRRCSTA